MFDSTAYAIGVSKPLSIFIKLAEGDESKVEKIKKLSIIISTCRQGVLDKCCNLIIQYMRKPLLMVTLEENLRIRVNFLGKKLIK